MKSIVAILFTLISTYSIAQEWTGEYHVNQMDTGLYGGYLTFEFENDHQFKVYSRECKSVHEGKGFFKVTKDSIFFFFSTKDTARTEVNITKLDYESSKKVKLSFEMFSKVRFDSIQGFTLKLKGKNVDTTLTTFNFKSTLELPRSRDTLAVTLKSLGSHDEVVFEIVQNESAQFKVWTTYVFDGFITEPFWAYRIERKKKKSFTLSTDGKKMKFKKRNTDKGE